MNKRLTLIIAFSLSQVYSSFLSYETDIIRTISQRQRRFERKSGTNKHVTIRNDNMDYTFDILPDVERIFAISDLHTDDVTNFSYLREICNSDTDTEIDKDILPTKNDCIIIAGDISHEIPTLKKSLEMIQNSFQCHVFFVPGNHEAWISTNDQEEYQVTNSLEKLELVADVCRSIGVRIDPCLVGTKHCKPVWIVPLLSWYDDSLALNDCEEFTCDFGTWPWADFRRCLWPDRFYADVDRGRNKIPSSALVGYFLSFSDAARRTIRASFESSSDSFTSTTSSTSSSLGLITFSHFLPSCKTLPDWKDPLSSSFRRDEWLDHGQPGTSAKFAKVAGSNRIDSYIRSFYNASSNTPLHHIHVFGHSHRPKDFIFQNIRYIHNPVGKPWERELNLNNPHVQFECVWDTSSRQGMVMNPDSTPIIRYWEDVGGGKEALIENIARRKKKRMADVQAIMNSGSIL